MLAQQDRAEVALPFAAENGWQGRCLEASLGLAAMFTGRLAVLALAAFAVGATGYVLTFYVRDPVLPLVGVVLMLLAAVLGLAAILGSTRPRMRVLGVMAVLPLAIFVWAVVHWLES